MASSTSYAGFVRQYGSAQPSLVCVTSATASPGTGDPTSIGAMPAVVSTSSSSGGGAGASGVFSAGALAGGVLGSADPLPG